MLVLNEFTEPDGEATAGFVRNMGDISGLPVSLGQPLAGRFPEVWIEITTPGPMTDYVKSGAMAIVSQKLANILEQEIPAEHFELLPVHIQYRGAPYEREKYFFFNLMHRVDALDRQRSRYETDEDWIDALMEPVPDEELAKPHKLFKLARCYVNITFVREDVAERIQAAGCTGLGFIRPANGSGERIAPSTRPISPWPEPPT